MRDEPFTIHPLLRKVYEQTQATLAGDIWSGLPATLDEIGPLLHVEAVMNEGEKRCGAFRAFVGLPGTIILEVVFYPLTGKVAWWWHKDGGAGGTPGDDLLKAMLWPGHWPMLATIYRVLELIEADEAGTYRSMNLWQMLQKHPEGRGYREFTKTAAKTLAKLAHEQKCRAIGILRDAKEPPEMPPVENDAWYAYTRQKPYHEDEREPLELWVGQAVWLPGGGAPGTTGVVAFRDDMLIIEIADKGRGEATIRRWPGSTLHGLSPIDIGRFFPIKEKFARHLWTFVTPGLEASYHVLKRLRESATVAPTPDTEPKEP